MSSISDYKHGLKLANCSYFYHFLAILPSLRSFIIAGHFPIAIRTITITITTPIIGILIVSNHSTIFMFYRLATIDLDNMHTILIINPKGGCGKSTISTQLAGYYANWGLRVALADLDPQKSSLNWLRQRRPDTEKIIGINAVKQQIEVPDKVDYLIIDTAAGYHNGDMKYLANRADNILIPVLPSAMDTHAAAHFIYQLLIKYRITFEDKNICIIANRVKIRSIVYRDLLAFLETLKLPLVSTLRESKYYLDCAANGLSIFDPNTADLSNLIADWQPITQWLHEAEMKKKLKKRTEEIAYP